MRSKTSTNGQSIDKRIRLWPGILIVVLQWLIRYGLPVVAPGAVPIAVLGGAALGIVLLAWWAFFSRAPRNERWVAIVLMVAALYVTSLFIHISIATGAQGYMFILFSIPVLSLVFVAWAVITRNLSTGIRWITMIAAIIIATGTWTLVRNDGITGDFNLMLSWRWSETQEERSLEQGAYAQVESAGIPVLLEEKPEWPGFRGPQRNNTIPGLRIETDWSSNAPKELWRTPVGPGCSSFAVSGDFIFTQEQRGEDEAVACYSARTGQLVWLHRYPARFWDSHAGAGPRSTPAIHDHFICTLGATGILNMLDARDGSVIWTRDIVKETGNAHSGWGCSSSPLIVDSLVIVGAIGQLVSYDLASGEVVWTGPDGGDSYSSPHLLTLAGITQVLMMSAEGITSIAPADGRQLWKYRWPGESRIVQPALTGDGDLVVCSSDGMAIRRIGVRHEAGNWSFEEKWTTAQMKPNFNDLVVHKGHAYGFNGSMLVCIDLETGERDWRGGRYGGQLMVLAEQDLLLVLSETGEVALVEAKHDKFNELASMDAIEGKTWNHPVVTGDVLLVRNTQEMAAFRIARAKS